MSNDSENKDTAIAKTEPPRTIFTSLAPHADQIGRALQGSIPEEQFMRIIATVWLKSPSLQKANFGSFVIAVVEAAELGLVPGNVLGEAYIVPRWNKDAGCMWAYFQLGYRGACKLARRGGEIVDIQPELVYANDQFDELKGTRRGIEHRAWYCVGAEEPGEVIAGYCTARHKDGTFSFRTIPRSEIDKACKASGDPRKDKESNVWRDHWEAMALKTCVHRLSKFLPMPDNAKEAIIRDEYREAGVSERIISAGDLDPDSIRIANARLDPANDERKALEKSTAKEHTDKRKEIKVRTDRIKESPAGEKFFKASNANRDTETMTAFVLWSAQVDEYPEDMGEQVEVLEKSLEFLVKWSTAEPDEAQELAEEFDVLVNGTPEANADARAEVAFDAAQGGG